MTQLLFDRISASRREEGESEDQERSNRARVQVADTSALPTVAVRGRRCDSELGVDAPDREVGY